MQISSRASIKRCSHWCRRGRAALRLVASGCIWARYCRGKTRCGLTGGKSCDPCDRVVPRCPRVRLAARGAPLAALLRRRDPRALLVRRADAGRVLVRPRTAAARPGPRAAADGRVARAVVAGLAPAPALPLLRRRVGRLRAGGGAETRAAPAARAGLPQGAAHAAARRLREGPVLNVETVTTVCLLTTARRRARAARGPSSHSRPCGRASPGRRRRCA